MEARCPSNSCKKCAHRTLLAILFQYWFLTIHNILIFLFWWFIWRVTPVLIPNTEVKPSRSDDTLFIGESSSPPEQRNQTPKNLTYVRFLCIWVLGKGVLWLLWISTISQYFVEFEWRIPDLRLGVFLCEYTFWTAHSWLSRWEKLINWNKITIWLH